MSEKRVLIIDDSSENIKILNEILKEDYTVMVTKDGEEALSMVKKHLPDLILLDIIMPNIDGYEVCRQLKNNHATSEIPIIFITSKNNIEDEELGLQLGAVDYITRPFSSAIVRARVKTHLKIKYQRDILKYSGKKYQTLFEYNTDGILLTDIETKQFKDANHKICEMLGYTKDEMLSMGIKDIHPQEDLPSIIEGFKAQAQRQKVLAENIPCLRKDGTILFVNINAAPIDINGNNFIFGMFRDVTYRKQAEVKQQELEAANLRLQKADSLGQMAGGIAHLFNNYLYAVSGNLELALEYLPNDSSIHNYLTEAMKAALRCSDVSGSMLYYLGQNFVKTQSLDIAECCQKHLSDFQSSVDGAITIETGIMDAELPVRVNASQMQQVLNHLITNACESIGENKGKISLVTRAIKSSDIPKIHLLSVDSKPSADNYVCVEIIDTGCGIPKKDLHKLSDPFFTTKFTGRGLGLAVVSGIVKSWDGFIGVRSKVGHGSTFMVFLPLSNDNLVRQSKKLAQSLQPQQKKFSTILLVDDNTAVLKITTIMLKKMGFEVISAVNGVEAVKLFKQHKESVSCLITDLSMPALDGLETLAEIRKIKPDIPAVLASGYDEAFAMSIDDSEKPQAFLHKPYTIADLKSVLEQAFS